MTYSNIDFLRDYNHVLPGSFTLTQAQEQIVTHGLGPMLVSAGPGSGKTECLVARALYLILVENASQIDIDYNIHAQSRSWTKGQIKFKIEDDESCKSEESIYSRYKSARNQNWNDSQFGRGDSLRCSFC